MRRPRYPKPSYLGVRSMSCFCEPRPTLYVRFDVSLLAYSGGTGTYRPIASGGGASAAPAPFVLRTPLSTVPFGGPSFTAFLDSTAILTSPVGQRSIL